MLLTGVVNSVFFCIYNYKSSRRTKETLSALNSIYSTDRLQYIVHQTKHFSTRNKLLQRKPQIACRWLEPVNSVRK